MSANASNRFSWNAGAIAGAALGASLWMPAAAFTSGWPSVGIAVAIAAASLILVSAWLLWLYRQRLPAINGWMILLAVGFSATLLFLAVASLLGLSLLDRWPGGKRGSPLSYLWVLLFYPALAVWFWFQSRGSSSSEPTAPPNDGSSLP